MEFNRGKNGHSMSGRMVSVSWVLLMIPPSLVTTPTTATMTTTAATDEILEILINTDILTK